MTHIRWEHGPRWFCSAEQANQSVYILNMRWHPTISTFPRATPGFSAQQPQLVLDKLCTPVRAPSNSSLSCTATTASINATIQSPQSPLLLCTCSPLCFALIGPHCSKCRLHVPFSPRLGAQAVTQTDDCQVWALAASTSRPLL